VTTTAGEAIPGAGPGVGAPRTGGRRADIQGLRAVAVLLVVAFHAGLDVPGGFVGVDVFFVISGFVITGMLLRELQHTGRVSFAEFYARRVRRILPALALTVTVVALLSLGAVSESERDVTARTGAAASVSLANVSLYRSPAGYFDPAENLNPLLQMWSLSVEEQFYLFFPALMFVGFAMASRRAGRRDRLALTATLVTLVAIASFLLCVYATGADVSVAGIDVNERFAFYLAPTRAWEFAVGGLVAFLVGSLERLPRSAAIGAGLAGAALVGYAAFAFSSETRFPGSAAAIPVVGTALLIAGGTASPAGLPQLLAARPMTWIGDLSYSWYLWHWPLIVFAVALFPSSGNAPELAAMVSLGVAWLAWRYLENPIRHDPEWRGRRAAGLAAVCIAVPIVASLVLARAPEPRRSAATRSFVAATRERHADRVRGCNSGLVPSAQPPGCTWPVSDASDRVVLVGDSNAGHFTEAMADAANGLGKAFTVATLPECPPVDLRLVQRGRRNDRCRDFFERTMDDLVANPPSTVVLAASTPVYLHGTGARLEDPTSGSRADSALGKAALWEEALDRTLARLEAAGIPTVVVHPVAQWLDWDGRNCAALRVYLAPRSCGAEQSRTEAEEFRRAAFAAEQHAARRHGAVTVDPLPVICGERSCVTNRGDRWVYRDGRHLTVPASLALTDQFALALRDALGAREAGAQHEGVRP